MEKAKAKRMKIEKKETLEMKMRKYKQELYTTIEEIEKYDR